MAYEFFDSANPSVTQVGSAFAASAKANLLSIRDAIVWGLWPQTSGYSYSQAGSASEPTSITATLNTEKVVADLTWSSGNITQIISKYYVSATATAEIASTATISYSAGEITAIAGMAMGPLVKLLPLLGKAKTLRSDFDTHTAATAGANAHNIGTVASQNSNNVSFTGGLMTGVTVGGTTGALAPVNSTYVRENVALYAQITAGGTIGVDLSSAGWHEISITNCTSTAVGTVGTITTSGDLVTAATRTLTAYVLVFVPAGAGTQYLNWTGYSWIVASQQALTEDASHIFVITQRSNGSTTVKLLNYLGKVV